MQYGMKTHQLLPNKVNGLLTRSITETLSTVNSDGSPYGVQVHYVYWNDAIYFHGIPLCKTNPHPVDKPTFSRYNCLSSYYLTQNAAFYARPVNGQR